MSSKRKAPAGGAEERNGAGAGKRRVHFRKQEDSEEEESDDSRAAARRRPPASRRLADGSDDDEDDEDEDENGGGAGSRGKGAAGRGFDGGDDDDDDDEPEAKRMVEDVHGEEDEDEHYERTNEAGDPMEPFNLRNERDMGYFDTNGNFVWKREEHERDAWLAEMDEGTMEEAIGAASNRAAKDEDTSTPARRAGAGDAPLRGDSLAGMSTVEMRDALIPLLEEGEAVTQALRRLGKRRKGEAGPARDRRRPGAQNRGLFQTTREKCSPPQLPAPDLTTPTLELRSNAFPSVGETCPLLGVPLRGRNARISTFWREKR